MKNRSRPWFIAGSAVAASIAGMLVASASCSGDLRASSGKASAAAASAAAPTATTTAPRAAGTWVSGYYVGYQSSMYPPSQVDFSAITHLLVGAVQPNPDGTLNTMFYVDPVNGPALAKDLAGRAHQAQRKALLMIGGAGGGGGGGGPASAVNRATFVKNLLGTMQSLGFDGLDLDWEPITDADQPLVLSLAQALRAGAPNIILTIPVGWGRGVASSFHARIAPYFDQINIMTYAMADAWPGWRSWHSSALAGESASFPTSVSSAAATYVGLGVPRAKIGIGIGFFGSCWKGVTGPRQAISGGVVASDNVMSYAHIMESYHASTAYQWDSAASASSLSFSQPHGPEGCTWVSYEDDASIQAKGRWVRENGFGGTIIWTVNQGYLASSRKNPPLDAVRRAFLQ